MNLGELAAAYFLSETEERDVERKLDGVGHSHVSSLVEKPMPRLMPTYAAVVGNQKKGKEKAVTTIWMWR